MVIVRLYRSGITRKKPFYIITVARDGRFIERVGTYNPLALARGDAEFLYIDQNCIDYWLSHGAQLSDTVSRWVEFERNTPEDKVDELRQAQAKVAKRFAKHLKAEADTKVEPLAREQEARDAEVLRQTQIQRRQAEAERLDREQEAREAEALRQAEIQRRQAEAERLDREKAAREAEALRQTEAERFREQEAQEAEALRQADKKTTPSLPPKKPHAPDNNKNPSGRQEPDTDDDPDNHIPKNEDYAGELARNEKTGEDIKRKQALDNKVNSLERYSYGWFLALLELESLKDPDNRSETISLSFYKIEQDSQSPGTIVLKNSKREIQQYIEECSDVPVDLIFGNGDEKTIRIECFEVKAFSLRCKLVDVKELSGIDLSKVLEARIQVQNPSFLLQALLERFCELELDEKFDMKAHLTPNIEFVFGPPGTGKTTHLAGTLIDMMAKAAPKKVLVLTPTNKAADVLTTRVMEKMDADTSYQKWLVRFGTSVDERIAQAGILKNRDSNIGALPYSVTVTTVARFSYDGFKVNEYGSKKLYEMEWDAIVIDEASMISLANIIYPLYRQKQSQFIIAGDPFQIEPIVKAKQWKNENIYMLVGLKSFNDPTTEPHEYSVECLKKQYRSVPSIGKIFSDFAYDSILGHERKEDSRRQLKLNGLDVKSLNLIKFRVSEYENIYCAKTLASGSHYQIYSALFTFEFVRWLAKQTQNNHADKDKKVSIGVIAPYRPQALLLSKLNDSWDAKPEGVEIQAGTIHAFQGDECDIIIAVFNPPPSPSRKMFLNQKNILNVAISRARDYLFIVLPTDDKTKGQRLCKIENLVKSSNAFYEYESHTIEEIIWGDAHYIENNTFSTGHQMVNVYRKPERRYEVRSDDSAIDVQIHEPD